MGLQRRKINQLKEAEAQAAKERSDSAAGKTTQPASGEGLPGGEQAKPTLAVRFKNHLVKQAKVFGNRFVSFGLACLFWVLMQQVLHWAKVPKPRQEA